MDDFSLKRCASCGLDLRVEYFARKNHDTRWLGDARLVVPREDTCSECASREAHERFLHEPIAKRLAPHLSRAKTRSQSRSVGAGSLREGLSVALLEEQWNLQEGACTSCKSKLDWMPVGPGHNLCSEDKEALGLWGTNGGRVLVVDRLDASDQTSPYYDALEGRKNFCFKCRACNLRKEYEEDIPGMLRKRNAELRARLEFLEAENRSLFEALSGQDHDETTRAQVDYLQGRLVEADARLENYKKVARENWTLQLNVAQRPTIKRQTVPLVTTPNKKRKCEESIMTIRLPCKIKGEDK